MLLLYPAACQIHSVCVQTERNTELRIENSLVKLSKHLLSLSLSLPLSLSLCVCVCICVCACYVQLLTDKMVNRVVRRTRWRNITKWHD